MATQSVTEHTFASTLIDNDIVLVDFWADWCAPCRQFAPVFEQASNEHPDIAFVSVDAETEHRLVAEANVSSIPTLMAFREQILVFAQPGALAMEQLVEVITAVRELDMDEVRRAAADKAQGTS